MADNAASLPRTLLCAALGAVLAFDAGFIAFAYQQGFFTVSKNPLSAQILPQCPDVSGLEQTLDQERQALEAKRAEVDAAAQELEELKKQVEIGAKPLEESRQRMEVLAQELDRGQARIDEEREKSLALTVKTFSLMKADQAVAILEKMDPVSAADVLARMKSKVSAKILEKMDPKKAGAVIAIVKCR